MYKYNFRESYDSKSILPNGKISSSLTHPIHSTTFQYEFPRTTVS